MNRGEAALVAQRSLGSDVVLTPISKLGRETGSRPSSQPLFAIPR